MPADTQFLRCIGRATSLQDIENCHGWRAIGTNFVYTIALIALGVLAYFSFFFKRYSNNQSGLETTTSAVNENANAQELRNILVETPTPPATPITKSREIPTLAIPSNFNAEQTLTNAHSPSSNASSSPRSPYEIHVEPSSNQLTDARKRPSQLPELTPLVLRRTSSESDVDTPPPPTTLMLSLSAGPALPSPETVPEQRSWVFKLAQNVAEKIGFSRNQFSRNL